jgi:VWFA-related protein
VDASRPAVDDRPQAEPRRYVLVLDYYHMGADQRTQVARGAPEVEVLERVREAVERLHVPGEQYMLLSLGQVLRVETPFTDDLEEITSRVDRMIEDRDLYAGFYGRLTERRWFERVLSLLDLMELIPGSKSVVLFSGPFLTDGWYYDETFWQIAAMAGRTRTAFYPVDSRGLVDSRGYVTRNSTILGPPVLGRLAVETGGRATAGTNDLGRGLARAQRDQRCRYTVGLYDKNPEPDRERKVRLFVRRSGHRVAHPTFYVVRSDEQEYQSRLRTASMVPSMFPGNGLSARLQLAGPQSSTRWNARVEVMLDPETLASTPEGTEWTLTGALRRPNGTVHQSFEQRAMAPEDPGEGLTIASEIQPRPGAYNLDVVLSHQAIETPLAATRQVEVPEIAQEDRPGASVEARVTHVP